MASVKDLPKIEKDLKGEIMSPHKLKETTVSSSLDREHREPVLSGISTRARSRANRQSSPEYLLGRAQFDRYPSAIDRNFERTISTAF